MSKLDLEDKEETSQGRATIHELPEGYLGRLQILKSGKARLMIGDVPFDVSLNSKSGFLQVGSVLHILVLSQHIVCPGPGKVSAVSKTF